MIAGEASSGVVDGSADQRTSAATSGAALHVPGIARLGGSTLARKDAPEQRTRREPPDDACGNPGAVAAVMPPKVLQARRLLLPHVLLLRMLLDRSTLWELPPLLGRGGRGGQQGESGCRGDRKPMGDHHDTTICAVRRRAMNAARPFWPPCTTTIAREADVAQASINRSGSRSGGTT